MLSCWHGGWHVPACFVVFPPTHYTSSYWHSHMQQWNGMGAVMHYGVIVLRESCRDVAVFRQWCAVM